MALCAASVAGICLAADGVESANIVGYNTVQCEQNKFYMFGTQFEAVGGGAANIQDYFKGTFAPKRWDDAGTYLQTAPKLQVWTPDGYTMCYYLEDGIKFVGEQEVTVEGWADLGGNYIEDSFPVGYGFWFKPTTDVTINFTGIVSAN